MRKYYNRPMLPDDLIEPHQNPRQAPPFTERQPDLTAAEGYGAPAALHRRRLAEGRADVGRKIAFTNRTLWARYGVYEPIWVYDRTLIPAEGHRAAVALPGLVQPRIEPAANGLHGRLVAGERLPVASLSGMPLSAGEPISSGTLTDAPPVAPGETRSTEISGLPLPGLTVRFE